MEGPDLRRQSLTDLISTLTDQANRLVRAELALAKTELRTNAKQAAVGGGLLSGAGLFGITAWLVFIAAAVAGIAVVLPVWASALIVAGALAVLAGIFALVGKGRLSRGVKPLPMTQDTVRTSVHELSTNVQENMHEVTSRNATKTAVGAGRAVPADHAVPADRGLPAEQPVLLPEPVLPPEPAAPAGRRVPAPRQPAPSEVKQSQVTRTEVTQTEVKQDERV